MLRKKLILAVFVSSFFLLSPNVTSLVRGEESGTSAGQGVVNYYINLFEKDWENGTVYDESMGVGSTQSDSISGSPSFTRHKRESLNVSENMSITPIHSPDNSEALIIDLINKANSTLLIEQIYISGYLDDILISIISAKDRGVDVKIIQDYSGYDEDGSNILENNSIPVRLLKSNSELEIPFDSQHNKGVIVDGEFTLICSINWSPTSIRQNREAGVIIESTTVASYYTDLFYFDWNRSAEYEPTGPGSLLISGSVTPVVPTTFSGAMNVTCAASPDNCFDIVNSSISKASTSIWISVYTLSSPYLIETLLDKIGEGVEVKLLLEDDQVSSYEKNYTLSTLYNLTVIGKNGNVAEGRLASEDFDFQHCKYAIIDNATLIISSGNWGMKSCPPEQPDGDVDGNRDWWFVIYGDGSLVQPNENTDDGYENNDVFSSATVIYSGSITGLKSLDDDWYVIHVDENSILNVSIVKDEGGTVILQLYDDDELLLSENDQFITCNVTTTGDYFIKVGFINGSTNYDLIVSIIPINDTGGNTEIPWWTWIVAVIAAVGGGFFVVMKRRNR